VEYRFQHVLRGILVGGFFVLLFISSINVYSQKQNKFDFKSSTPEEFIEFLKNSTSSYYAYTIYKDYGPPENWVKEEHISRLIELIDSEEPCLHVDTVSSSTIPHKLSTVGNEAMFLIIGFKENRYPSRSSSIFVSSSEKEGILKWWHDRQNQQPHEIDSGNNP